MLSNLVAFKEDGNKAELRLLRLAEERWIDKTVLVTFAIWTCVAYSIVGLCAILFFYSVLSFTTSTKISLYVISIWLNGWLLTFMYSKKLTKRQFYHNCYSIWTLSYTMTNIMWEIPWLIFSRFVFKDITSLEQVVANTEYMRSSLFHMYYWILASFGSVDLRTVNNNATFFSLELYSFINVVLTCYFFYLNYKRSPYRYIIAVIGSGEPIAFTFMFSFTEVVNGFQNMAGGIADTLLALLWTQYQYILFPMLFSAIGFTLLIDDWQYCFMPSKIDDTSYFAEAGDMDLDNLANDDM